MGLLDKLKKKEQKIDATEAERRDRLSVISAGGQAARKRKDIMDSWKTMCKNIQYDWVERIIYLVTEDLKTGGVKVPTNVDQVLDGSAAIMSMAEASAAAVEKMANEQIVSIQQTVANHRVYLANVEEDITNAEGMYTQMRADIAEEKVRLDRARKNYADFMKEITEGDKPVAPSEITPLMKPAPIVPEPVPGGSVEDGKELSLKERAEKLREGLSR